MSRYEQTKKYGVTKTNSKKFYGAIARMPHTGENSRDSGVKKPPKKGLLVALRVSVGVCTRV